VASTSNKSTEPVPHAVAQAVGVISECVQYADWARSHIIETVELYLGGIRLLSIWENPVPGTDAWMDAAQMT